MQIRIGKISDVHAIGLINKKAMGYCTGDDILTQRLKRICDEKNHELIVATQADDCVVGYIHVETYTSLYMDSMFNILGFAIDPQFQHQGIATQLLHAIETEAQQRNYSGIRLNSGTERLAAHQFYEKSGYMLDKTQFRFQKKF
ncbi:GNAT family N-acetyltransferase [Weissella viridescens]|uniref:GNAT family N-acetyltransferase n=1 Tax=Weissella viridescens TaxID=1629 RepID=UPI001D09316F|nr:GNAT family N-acetyltransferase [Weissella viridescens]MCB6839585.1 GNAT family N-acetyltransferase [Weissella viridescens]MCB6846316.1 GNAT family N-acetyltransferase [Weissella viridescens]